MAQQMISQTRRTSLNTIVMLAVLTVLLLLILTAFSYYVLVSARGNAFDFTPRYVGTQAFLRGNNPYDPSVTAEIQRTMFGGTLYAEMDQQRFAYPAYTALLLAPLTLLPLPIANALWMAANLCGILVSIALWMSIRRYKPKPVTFFAVVFALVFVFRYSMNLYLVGQFVGVMLAVFSLAAYLLLHRRQDVLAGILLALATNPPTIALPFAVLVLMGYALHGRWRGLVAFAVTMSLLIILPMFVIGNWLPDFFANLSDYAQYARPVWALGQAHPLLAFTVTGGSLALLYYTWRRLDVAFWSLGVIVTLLLVPQTGNYYLALLIIPLVAALPALQRWGWLLWLTVVVSGWMVVQQPVEAFMVPSLVLLLTYLVFWRDKSASDS